MTTPVAGVGEIGDGREPEADAIAIGGAVDSLRACKDPQKRHAADLIEYLWKRLSDCLSTLRYAQETLDAAFPGMDEGAPFEHIVRKVVARHQASDAYAIQLRDAATRATETIYNAVMLLKLINGQPEVIGMLAGAKQDLDAVLDAKPDTPRTVDFQLDQRTAETLDAERYRYLRTAAGQWSGDVCGPMVCSGCGDNFEYLRGEEVDQEVDEAMAEWKAAGSPVPTTLSSYKDAKP